MAIKKKYCILPLFRQKLVESKYLGKIILNKIIQKLGFFIIKLFSDKMGKLSYKPMKTTYFDPYYYVLPSINLGYFVTAKIASSSIIAVLLNKELGIPLNNSPHSIAKEKMKRMYSYPTNYYTFTFVRNPFDRLVSFYENKLIKKDIFFDYYLFGYLSNPKNFDTFIQKICNIPDFLQDSHFIILYNIIYDNKGLCKADFIGRYERLLEDYKIVQEKFDLPDLPHYKKNENKKDWRDYYTLKTAQMVYEKYKKDIIAFGYEKDYQDLIEHIKNKSS